MYKPLLSPISLSLFIFLRPFFCVFLHPLARECEDCFMSPTSSLRRAGINFNCCKNSCLYFGKPKAKQLTYKNKFKVKLTSTFAAFQGT